MKNLIYQYWVGRMEPMAFEGKKAMEEYAKLIGAEYRFDKDPKFIAKMTAHASHMSALRPVFDSEFHTYDKVMYIDLDIFPVDGLTENIFECDTGEMALCEEIHQPEMRNKIEGKPELEQKWARLVKEQFNVEMPKTENNLYRVFNSGLVIYW